MSFLKWYFELHAGEDEQAVHCPFPHMLPSGLEYYESNPSAHVNTEKGVFHCKACGRGYNELQFMVETLGCKARTGRKLLRAFYNQEDRQMWEQTVASQPEMTDNNRYTREYGLSVATLKSLGAAIMYDGTLKFPVFMYDKLIDIRTYNPGAYPKVQSRGESTAGLIVPFDIWRESPVDRLTCICAGEKDMAISRQEGFNAITLTGGESVTPTQLNYFKGRHVAILYDNDAAGMMGAVKLALHLQGIAASTRVVFGHHTVCQADGEDIHDFFIKYGRTADDLKAIIGATPLFNPEDYPGIGVDSTSVTLHQASQPEYINKMLRSDVQVVATSEQIFHSPTELMVEKRFMSDKPECNLMQVGELREWELTDTTAADLLHLIDNNFKENDIFKNKFSLLSVPGKERGIKFYDMSIKPVYKCSVTDMFESSTDEAVHAEYVAYSVGVKLESGKKYSIKYRLVPHPYKGQQLTMIIFHAEQANDSVSGFKLNDVHKSHLDEFIALQGTVAERISILAEKVKGLIGFDGNNDLITSLDLAYHTPLRFNIGRFKDVRAYLDTIIVGESRIGKTSTIEAFQKTYQLGTMTSLAGNSATVPGLIGGSNKVQGSFQTRAGLIPQNHMGLMILEEFGKCNANIVKELTDIRSSNEVRITRVSGNLTLPAMVRMIALTNPKSTGSEIRAIASYPDGISVITELVGTAEDIARYDIMLVLADRGADSVDIFWEPDTPFPAEVYQSRIRWVWSRTPDQIIIDSEVGHYILEKANSLNAKYNSHVKIFGTEAWKKLARVAIAVAGYLVSTDETYENIIVTKEHVDFAHDYFISIYDNDTFKLGPYVEHERKYRTIDDEGVAALQEVYLKSPGLLLQLEVVSKTNKNMLQAASGLDNNEYNASMSRLVGGMFVRYNNSDILPTERFRLGMARIDRNTTVRRIGDNSVGLQIVQQRDSQ